MTSDPSQHVVIETLDTILSLAYIPALVVLVLAAVYYLAPFLKVESRSKKDLRRRVRLILSLLLLLIWIGITIFQMSR